MEIVQLTGKAQVPDLTRHLLNSIIKVKPLEIANIARNYTENGVVKYDEILSVPLLARIPNLTHVYGLEKIHAVMLSMLSAFCNTYNVVRPMTDEQLTQCAYDLVLTTEEDLLSIEDFIVFFKGAKEGKYGKIFDRLDQQTIFDMLEIYRDQRHAELKRIRHEIHIQRKAEGATERVNQVNPIEQGMYNLVGRLSDLKEKLKVQKEINRANRL